MIEEEDVEAEAHQEEDVVHQEAVEVQEQRVVQRPLSYVDLPPNPSSELCQSAKSDNISGTPSSCRYFRCSWKGRHVGHQEPCTRRVSLRREAH